jgi:hypothetical protein
MRRSFSKYFSVLIAFLLLISGSLTPLVHPKFDVPVTPGNLIHITLSDDAETHEHDHNKVLQSEKFGHSNNHNPADHSHDGPDIEEYRRLSTSDIHDRWPVIITITQAQNLMFDIEFPPRLWS